MNTDKTEIEVMSISYSTYILYMTKRAAHVKPVSNDLSLNNVETQNNVS